MIDKMTSGQRDAALQLLEDLRGAPDSIVDENLIVPKRESRSERLNWISAADADWSTPTEEAQTAARKVEAVDHDRMQSTDAQHD